LSPGGLIRPPLVPARNNCGPGVFVNTVAQAKIGKNAATVAAERLVAIANDAMDQVLGRNRAG
jgi:hypothetical protein